MKMFRALRSCKFLSSETNLARINQIRHAANEFRARPALNNNSNKANTGLSKLYVRKCISELTEEINRTGRVTQKKLQVILNSLEATGEASTNLISLLMQCCGEFKKAVSPKVRIDNTKILWNSLKNSGIKRDVSHYNALLQTYLKNEYKFLPEEILDEMAKNGVKPNRLTYQHFITSYCREGDLAGASQILELMKTESITLNENVFHSLILGHCITKDVVGAKNVMKIMQEKNFTIGSSTYTSFLCGLALCGDFENFESTLKECADKNITFRSYQLVDIIHHLFKGGNQSRALEMIKSNISAVKDDLPDLIIRILHEKQYDICLQIRSLMKPRESASSNYVDKFIFEYLVEAEPFEKLVQIARHWEENGGYSNMMTSLLYHSLKGSHTDKSMDILYELRKNGQPVKMLYFWPMIADAVRENDVKQILSLLNTIKNDFGFIIPNFVLESLIFKNLSVGQNAEKFLMVGLNRMGVPWSRSAVTYVNSVMDKTSELEKLDHNMDPVVVVHALCASIMSAIKKNPVKTSSGNEEQSELSSGEGTQDVEKIAQGIVDNFMMEIVSKFVTKRENFEKQLLQELAAWQIPISKAVGEEIKGKWNDPETAAIIDELTEKKFDLSRVEKAFSKAASTSNSRDTISGQFLKCCQDNKIDEAEKMIKDNPSLAVKECATFMRALKRTNNEEKLSEFLKNYAAEISENLNVKTGNRVFIQTEFIRKGFIKEACRLVGEQISESDRAARHILFDTMKPVFEKGSREEINMVLSLGQGHLLELRDVMEYFVSRKAWNVIMNILANIPKNQALKWRFQPIIADFINHGEMEYVNKIIGIMEEKFEPYEVASDTIFALACMGNVKKGQEFLDKVKANKIDVPKTNLLRRTEVRMTVTEDLIKILEGDSRFKKMGLYEDLVEMYDTNNVDPVKGLELWDRLQEENVIPSGIFLAYLGRLLRKNNIEVPFDDGALTGAAWIIEGNIPRNLQHSLLEQFRNDNFTAIRKRLHDAIAYEYLPTSSIRLMLRSVDGKKDVKNENVEAVLKYALNLVLWRIAFFTGEVHERAMKFQQSNESKPLIDIIPNHFFCCCLMNVKKDYIRKEVAQVIFWAYLNIFKKETDLAKIYETAVENIFENKTIMEEVLEIIPCFKHPKSILSVLNENKVFERHNLETEMNYVLQALPSSDGRRSRKQIYATEDRGRRTMAGSKRNTNEMVADESEDARETLQTDESPESNSLSWKSNEEKQSEFADVLNERKSV